MTKKANTQYKVVYFDRWAEGWYALPQRFKTNEDAEAFLSNPRSWPKSVDSRALMRAVHDSAIQIIQAN